MRIHLFRHGQTNWNAERRIQGQSESQLNELGIQQAKELSARIREQHFDVIYCSSSVRTRETADHAFGDRATPIHYLDTLREIQMGAWEGELYADIEARAPDSFRHFWHEPHLFNVDGAETFAELQSRALTALDGFARDHSGQDVAVVSHGALIKSVLCHAAGRELKDLWAPPSMHNCAHSLLERDAAGNYRILIYADQAFTAA
ncbi:MAG: histidine phosphatase family protein [Gammaproteobacteria bacterium]